MIDDFYRTYKPEIIRVRLSTPFLARTRCKFCQGTPSMYYYVQNPTLWFNPRRVTDQLEFVKKYVKRMSSSHFMYDDPKYFTGQSTFAHQVSYKGYRPKLHRTRGSAANLDIVEHLTCDCGRANWAFTEKAVKSRPEIMARKARYRFPQKFEF